MVFPQELYDLVASFIPTSDKVTLRSLSIASHACHAAAAPHLFYNVEVATRERQERFYQLLLSDEGLKISRLIREYSITIREDDVRSGLPYTHTAAALARMQRLCKLRLNRVRFPKAVLSSGQILSSTNSSWCLPALRELQWPDFGIEHDLISFLKHCPALETLHLLTWQGPPPPSNILPKLQKLTGDSSVALAFLPGRHVEDVEIDPPCAESFAEFVTYLSHHPEDVTPHIRRLSIPKFETESFIPDPLMSILPCLPHLERLQVCTTQLRSVVPHTQMLENLIQLVLVHEPDIFDPAGFEEFSFNGTKRLWCARIYKAFSRTPLGKRSSDACLEFWMLDEMCGRWQRCKDGSKLVSLDT
ncbi:hypothetical protein CYLTODRAFT_493612 [Cylindrobasidium torrendii FP15055 ss-10]|uniref:F-box domain-containing protein n=1 Tax=Cylindrobasidium torrendii FP15055 ss-10 TaxID=1314674 RepID=A0A0D7AZN2_9AGAR|nr:hypothetical protein CYLTODRAFT_493612 [Cylindrobasidium torrendii FP15055 ss-10]